MRSISIFLCSTSMQNIIQVRVVLFSLAAGGGQSSSSSEDLCLFLFRLFSFRLRRCVLTGEEDGVGTVGGASASV